MQNSYLVSNFYFLTVSNLKTLYVTECQFISLNNVCSELEMLLKSRIQILKLFSWLKKVLDGLNAALCLFFFNIRLCKDMKEKLIS